MVERMLNGIYSGTNEEIATATIELLRSDETLDRHTRAAIADALERDLEGRRDTLRMRMVRPDGGSATMFDEFDRNYELQEIADEVKRLRSQGLTRQQAIGEIIDSGRAKRTKIEQALRYAKHTHFRLSLRKGPD